MTIRNPFLGKAFLRLIAAPAMLAGAFFLLSPQAPAQISKVGEVVLAGNESARGVGFEWPYAYVSLFNDGVQWIVDLSNPFTPTPVTSFNPAFGDQWNENFVQKGQFVCGHRFGGLNLWDVSNPNNPFQLDTASTNYHFDGLDILAIAGQTLLFYSEVNASNGPGGLRVYDITSNLLTNIGNSVVGNNQRDGRFLIATSDNWVYQLDGGAGSTRPLNLNVYDVSNPANPVHVQMFNMGNAVGSYLGFTDLELDPTERILYAACGYDGLRMIDIGVRPSPVVVNTKGAPGFYVRELSYLPGTIFMVVSVRWPNGQWRCHVLDCSIPPNPVMVFNWFGDANYTIHDIRAVSMSTGAAVLVAGRNAAGDATLQVWM